jgi:hypothetical protein
MSSFVDDGAVQDQVRQAGAFRLSRHPEEQAEIARLIPKFKVAEILLTSPSQHRQVRAVDPGKVTAG